MKKKKRGKLKRKQRQNSAGLRKKRRKITRAVEARLLPSRILRQQLRMLDQHRAQIAKEVRASTNNQVRLNSKTKKKVSLTHAMIGKLIGTSTALRKSSQRWKAARRQLAA
jgi:hypothetical protein